MNETGFHIDDPPDPSRPRNPWPRLLAFGFMVLIAVVIFGACLVAYSRSVPDRELEVAESSLEVGLPRLLPAIPFGADRFGFTFGAWVVRTPDGQTHALLSMDPGSGCHVQWDATRQLGEDVGAFVDPCDGSQYGANGEAYDGPTPRGLDRFPFEIEDRTVTVDIEQVRLGKCSDAGNEGGAGADCSTPDNPVSRDLPDGPLR